MDLRNRGDRSYACGVFLGDLSKVPENTRNFATGLLCLLALIGLGATACNKDSRGSLPGGSMGEASSCKGSAATQTDVNGDGRPDIEHIARGGRPYCMRADMNFDGKVDVERFYEESTGVVSHERHDFDFDGRIDQLAFFENGQLERKELDTNFDNNIDTWLWCENGWVVRAERDRRSDGLPDVWEIYESGLLSEAKYDDNHDGKIERWDSFENGKLAVTKTDTNNDGEPDRTDHMPQQSLGPADEPLRCEIDTVAAREEAASGSGVAQPEDRTQLDPEEETARGDAP